MGCCPAIANGVRAPTRLAAAAAAAVDGEEWHRLLGWFSRGLSSTAIAAETDLHRQRVLRALTIVREATARHVVAVFRGTVEIDKTHVRAADGTGAAESGRERPSAVGVPRRPPCSGSSVGAASSERSWLPDAEAATLLTLLGCRAQRGSAVCSGALPTKAGVAGKGYVHLLVNHTNGDYAPNCGAHIHGWEGFWGRLKRQLATKGGIRRSQLPLYFAEYVWRYTHRGDSRTAQITRLQLLRSSGS